MALPWLVGAAAVATVGYLANSSSSNNDDYDDDDDYYEAKEREKKIKKAQRKEAKNNFYKKWGVKHKADPIDAPKIQKLINQEKELDKKIKELEALALEITNI